MKLTVFYYYADFFAFFLLVILARAATLSLSLHIDWSSRGLSKKKIDFPKSLLVHYLRRPR